MKQLRITSFLGTNTIRAMKAVAGILSREQQIPVQFVGGIPWQEQVARLDLGMIEIGWMCGLDYVKQVAEVPGNMELLAAPIFSGNRYNNRPVYFSDIIVRADGPYQSFDHLRGATWVYNERRSYSGYYLMYQFLDERHEDTSFFGQHLESGSHRKALQMVLDNQADVAAIDSTILDFELSRQLELRDQIRVLQSLGPSPVPPWVVSKRLPPEQRIALRHALLHIVDSVAGRATLENVGLTGFVPVEDAAYDPVRQVASLVDN